MKIANRQFRKLIRESMKFQHGQRLDTWDTLEELGPGDRITVDGKPATVFDVEEGDEIYIVYVLDGKKSKKELSMFDALLPSETEEDEEDYDDFYYEDGEPQSEFVDEKPEVEVRYIAPGKDLFDEPGLRKSPGRRNRPMTSHVPPVAEGKKVRITKRQLRRIIREQVEDEMAGRDIKLGLGGKPSGAYQHAHVSGGATDNLDSAIRQMLVAYAPNEVIEELQAIIEDIRSGTIK